MCSCHWTWSRPPCRSNAGHCGLVFLLYIQVALVSKTSSGFSLRGICAILTLIDSREILVEREPASSSESDLHARIPGFRVRAENSPGLVLLGKQQCGGPGCRCGAKLVLAAAVPASPARLARRPESPEGWQGCVLRAGLREGPHPLGVCPDSKACTAQVSPLPNEATFMARPGHLRATLLPMFSLFLECLQIAFWL